MKRIIFSMLALLGVMLLHTSPANAQTWASVTRNGVTCQQLTMGSTYPANGHYSYCGADASTITRDAILAKFNTILSRHANVRTALQGTNPAFWIFEHEVARNAFAAWPSIPTSTQMLNWYNDAVTNNADGASSGLNTYVYEKKPDGAGGYTTLPSSTVMHTFVHEMGHQFDSARGNVATQVGFIRVAEKDFVNFDVVASVPTAVDPAIHRQNYSHFLVRNAAATVPWYELYAEQFAGYIIAYDLTHGNVLGALQHPVYSNVLSPYMACSATWVEKNIVNNLDPTDAQLGSACVGPVVCREYNPGSETTYPNRAFATRKYDSWVCGKLNTTTPNGDMMEAPTPTRAQELYVTKLATELAKPANNLYITNKLIDQKVKYYFFKNRALANEFFGYQKPFNSVTLYQTTDTAERCGHTYYHANGKVVAVAIYDECALSTGSTTNPDLLRTSINETGKAFAYAFERQTAGSNPMNKAGFTAEYNNDVTNISPPSANWTPASAAQKEAFICAMFGSVGNSQLEVDMGAPTANPPATPTNRGPVCTSGVVNPPWKTSPTTFDLPGTIATTRAKVPTEILGSKQEIWAEEFTVILLGKTSPSNVMPITDTFIGLDTPPALGSYIHRRSMHCTRFVVETFRTTGAKPTNSQLSGVGCPTHADYNP